MRAPSRVTRISVASSLPLSTSFRIAMNCLNNTVCGFAVLFVDPLDSAVCVLSLTRAPWGAGPRLPALAPCAFGLVLDSWLLQEKRCFCVWSFTSSDPAVQLPLHGHPAAELLGHSLRDRSPQWARRQTIFKVLERVHASSSSL